MFYLQLARGLTPTESALLLIPLAILSGVLAPFAGKLLDRTDPRFLLVPGLLLVGGSLALYAALIFGDAPIWAFLIPSALMGIGSAGMWGPLATTATRNLPPRQAGAGAGIYNTTRTVGSVIGSASVAAFMQARLEANLPGAGDAGTSFGGGVLPPQIVEGFSTAMGQSLFLPIGVIVLGLVAVLFMRRPSVIRPHGSPRDEAPAAQVSADPAGQGSAPLRAAPARAGE
jgi:MFS family permease